MQFLFVGDTHGTLHLNKVKDLLFQVPMRENDVLFQLGDIGVAFLQEDDEQLRFWRSLPFHVVVCLGNHENYRFIQSRPVIKKHGCQGYDLGGRVFAPLPGQTLHIAQKTLWCYPGGYSVDFFYRKPGRDLFKEELLEKAQSDKIINAALRRRHIDFILSHDGPLSFVRDVLNIPLQPPPDVYFTHLGIAPQSRVHPAFQLERLLARPDLFDHWFFGHHHRDVAHRNLRCLFDTAVRCDTLQNTMDLIPISNDR